MNRAYGTVSIAVSVTVAMLAALGVVDLVRRHTAAVPADATHAETRATYAPPPHIGATKVAAQINTAALAAVIKSRAPFVLLDARPAADDDGRRIPGAIKLPAAASPEQIAALVPEKNTLIVTYCQDITCPAGERLARHLEDLGYLNVVQYPEGIAGWTAAGRPLR